MKDYDREVAEFAEAEAADAALVAHMQAEWEAWAKANDRWELWMTPPADEWDECEYEYGY